MNKHTLAVALGRVGSVTEPRSLVGVVVPLGPSSGSSWDGGMVGGEVAGLWTGRGGWLGGEGAGAPKAGRGQPSPAQGAASQHRRAEVPAAAWGTGPHLQVWDQGLKSARRTARTCPAGRHRGGLGWSRRRISAWGSVGEERGPPQTPGAGGEDLVGE